MGEELFTMQNGRELGIEYYRESARLEELGGGSGRRGVCCEEARGCTRG